MEAEERVLARLGRIEALEREGAPPRAVLDEVRGLLVDTETWLAARPKGSAGAAAALDRCREAMELREVAAMA